MTTYWCEHAWLPPGEVVADVLIETDGAEITWVARGGAPTPAAIRLAGLTIPGFANCHSHAFHRALRGRTQRERGTFWTWRDQMYAVAERLNPDSYYRLAKATYREMAAAGVTRVGEFHYLHHGPGGTPYDDPNAMGLAVIAAAKDAGIAITLLDTCYLAAGIGAEPEGVQCRFSDRDVDGWRGRVERLTGCAGSDVTIGAAIHSVRAVPRDQLPAVADWAAQQTAPLHVHLSEQRKENEACRARYGRTPTAVLAEAGALGERTSVVHATHLTQDDVAQLGRARVNSCFCQTTERDLGDGIGPSRRLQAAGSTVTLGSDSHAVIDLFEEMRALEMDERLATQQRGHWTASELLAAASPAGHASLGADDAGAIRSGARADLVTLDLSSPRTAGSGPNAETVVFAATAADVVHVVAAGRVVATAADAAGIGRELAASIDAVLAGA